MAPEGRWNVRWTQGCPSVSRVGTCRGRLLAVVTKLSVMPGPTQTNDPGHLGLSPAAGSVRECCVGGSSGLWRPIGFVDTGRCCRSDAGDVEGAQILAVGPRRQGVGKFSSGAGPTLFDAGAPMFS